MIYSSIFLAFNKVNYRLLPTLDIFNMLYNFFYLAVFIFWYDLIFLGYNILITFLKKKIISLSY